MCGLEDQVCVLVCVCEWNEGVRACACVNECECVCECVSVCVSPGVRVGAHLNIVHHPLHHRHLH